MATRKEIRILDPKPIVWDTVLRLAKEEMRSAGKQAEYMLGLYIKEKKLNKTSSK